MKKMILLIAVIAISCQKETQQPANSIDFSKYKALAGLLINGASQPDKKTLQAEALQLISEATLVGGKLKEKFPDCNQKINFALNNVEKMKSLTVEQIEEQYHDKEDEAEHDDHDDHEDKCQIASEVIIHAVEAFAASKTLTKDNRETIKDELEEVLDHISELQ